MEKFLVLYMAPASVIAEWMKTDPDTRKAAEEKMKGKWQEWMKKYEGQVIETAGAGKDKRITSEGITDATNDVMMYSLVEAESQDAAATLFEGHPHLGIPQAWIEVMPANALPVGA
ncbi:MAG: hypothetical protein V4480_00480 [Patescibacteria group bacterium]